MEQKILILGAKGMLGHALAEIFLDKNPVLWDMVELDITKKDEVEKKLKELKPTLILNASGFTDVDGAESNKEAAMAVNGQAIGYLTQTAKELAAILVHYSTDYVFDGTAKEGYKEDDKPNPLSVYGKSKLLGEKLLQEKGEMYYLIRSSWMFGEHGPNNFIETISTKAKEKGSLKVVNDQFGKPTYAKDLAKKTREIIDQSKPCGIYHVTNKTKEGGISWYEFAKKIIELSGISAEITACTSEEFSRLAKRPENAALINTKLEPMRNWDEAVKDYLDK